MYLVSGSISSALRRIPGAAGSEVNPRFVANGAVSFVIARLLGPGTKGTVLVPDLVVA